MSSIDAGTLSSLSSVHGAGEKQVSLAHVDRPDVTQGIFPRVWIPTVSQSDAADTLPQCRMRCLTQHVALPRPPPPNLRMTMGRGCLNSQSWHGHVHLAGTCGRDTRRRATGTCLRNVDERHVRASCVTEADASSATPPASSRPCCFSRITRARGREGESFRCSVPQRFEFVIPKDYSQNHPSGKHQP